MKPAKQRRGRPTVEGVTERKLRSAQRGRRATAHRMVKSDWFDTGTFGANSPPKEVGVSPEVGYANRQMAKAARRAERKWMAARRATS